MMRPRNWREYARLLRRAWLNPSHKPWHLEVHAFEHKHPELRNTFRKWQDDESKALDTDKDTT